MKKFLIILITFFMLLISGGDVLAQEQASGSSATLDFKLVNEEPDHRVIILREYLEERNSPLAPHAKSFIVSADKYNLDWRLVVSISGLESGFGKHQPLGSHNGWGWGYNNGTVKHFDSWDAAIEEISMSLRQRYLRNIEYSDPYIIGPTYATSPTWAPRVASFMNNIEGYRIRNAKYTLTLDI